MHIHAIKAIFACCAISLLSSSCANYKIPAIPVTKDYTPSVTLNDGRTITGSEITQREKFFGPNKIFIGDSSYRTKDVAFCQTHSNRYANTGDGEFAVQTVSGKINVYALSEATSSPVSASGAPSHSHTYHYLQNGDEVRLEPFSRKAVRDMVSSSRPALNLMAQSDREARTAKIIVLSGLGAAALGIGLMVAGASKSGADPNNKSAGNALVGIGLGLFVASPFTISPWSIFGSRARRHAYEAVNAYNRSK